MMLHLHPNPSTHAFSTDICRDYIVAKNPYRLSQQFISRYPDTVDTAVGSPVRGVRWGEGRMSKLTFDSGCWDSCCFCHSPRYRGKGACYCHTAWQWRRGGVMGNGQAAPVAQHQQYCPSTLYAHTRAHVLPALKSIKKQHTRSIWCLQLTHSETTASSAAAWKSLRVKQIMYPISQRAGLSVVVVGGSATSSRRHAICCYLLRAGQASKLSTCYLHTGTPPHYSWTDVCMLMSSIRISLVVAPAQYRRHSLSHDIVAMCGWRSISRYRLIDIIPTVYTIHSRP